jgi:type I restriction enzyme S subunit
VTKGTTPVVFASGNSSGLVNFVKVESMGTEGDLLPAKFMQIDQRTTELLSRSILQEDDILFSIAGTIGRVARVRRHHLPANTNQAVAIIRPDKKLVDVDYLYYVLRDRRLIQQALTRVVQSVQANFSLAELSNLEIPLPPLAKQRNIARALGTFDDLIETNQRLTDDLRTLVASEYRRTIALSSEIVRASEVLDLRYGKALLARDRKPGPISVVSSAGIVGCHDVALVKGPGIVVGRKGTVGSVTWVPGDFFPIDTAFYVETRLPLLFAYFSLLSMGLTEMNTHSAVPGLNRVNALGRKIHIPQKSQLLNFSKRANPLWDAATHLDNESVSLRGVRDELLPLLLSGSILVREVAA